MTEEETVQACENIVRHAEVSGAELFEKNFIKDGNILATVFCTVGRHAEEVTALVREWANNKGLNEERHEDEGKAKNTGFQPKWASDPEMCKLMADMPQIGPSADEVEYMEQMDAGYQVYAEQRSLYEKLIEKEGDPDRKKVLEGLLGDLNEENK